MRILFLSIFFGIATIIKLTTRWVVAKVTGKPYDSGMDM